MRLSAIWNALPSVVILGAQKAGTTSLYKYLAQHPSFAEPRRKEVSYFDNNFDRSIYWYKNNFRPAWRGISFEATPYYLFHPAVPERVRKTLPKAKFIILLRDPVARAISHYHHMASIGLEDLQIEEALRAEEDRLRGAERFLTTSASARVGAHDHHSYVSRSLYSQQTERWLDYFPRSRFLFLTSEQMFRDPQEAVDSVCQFMDVPSYRLTNTDAANQRSYPTASRAVREFISERVAEDTSRLPRLIGFKPEWA